MTSTEFKKNISKIKKLLKQRSNISLLSHIEELYISRNAIWELPSEFVKLSNLKILGLAGNANLVPEEIINKIGKLKKLRKLYISSDRVQVWSKGEGRKFYDMEKTFEKLKKLLPGLIIETDPFLAFKDH